MKKRCSWAENIPLYEAYHDKEWGVPVHNDKTLFEFLTLETFQSGLSWITILKKREQFREAFDQFDFYKVASYGEQKFTALMNDRGIIRNRLKIQAAINNAQQFINVQKIYGSFSNYIWNFVQHKQKHNHFAKLSDIPAQTELSLKISRSLKKHGFKFIGATVMYAHMQATGMVNDHTTDCFRHQELLELSQKNVL